MLAETARLIPAGKPSHRTCHHEGKAESDLDNAVASFARRVVDTRGQVSDADLAAARSAGLGDAQIIEVIGNVAINVLTNYTNNVALTDIAFPKVDVKLRPPA